MAALITITLDPDVKALLESSADNEVLAVVVQSLRSIQALAETVAKMSTQLDKLHTDAVAEKSPSENQPPVAKIAATTAPTPAA